MDDNEIRSGSDEAKTPVAPKIDIGSIANREAVEKLDKDFSKLISASKKSKFNFLAPELVQLPSGGRLYNTDDEDIKKGFIRLRPMTMAEEEILATPRFLKTGSATRMVLANCIESNIDSKDLLVFDSNFLLFRLRQISYGDEYTFKIKCDNSICGKEFEHTVNITDLKFEELPEGIVEPIVTKLPHCKYTVYSVLPRLSHTEEMYIRNVSKKKTTEDSDRRFLDNAVITTVAIKDNKGKDISPNDWDEFYSALIGVDAAAIRKATSISTGFDKLEGVACPYCETDYSGTIPIGAEFFRF